MRTLVEAIVVWTIITWFSHVWTSATPIIVPTVKSWVPASPGDKFILPPRVSIVVDSKFQGHRDQDGLTLIPPSLREFASTFTSDIAELFPKASPRLSIGNQIQDNTIFLTLDTRGKYTLANGKPTSEGYTIQIGTKSVKVSGASPLGVWRGVTTLLQGLVQRNASHPVGTIIDQPDWPTRGIMIDVGRQWYPTSYLKEMCAYFSYFKASEFHLHLSDNLPALLDGSSTYARFRLYSPNPQFAGLTPHVNETYSREDFDDLQRSCAARGVTIVPEIEAPGHALVITQWKPELALDDDPSLLNLSLPASTQTMHDIWAEHLPHLHSKQVSIGADEYASSLADDYLRFVANMSDFIRDISGGVKSIRSWGTFEPSDDLTLTKGTTVQHWDGGQDNALELLEQGYNLINSEDAFLYIVMKQSGGFPQKLDQNHLWTGNEQGGPWDPTKFNRQATTLSAPTLLGGIMAIWSDQGPTASTPLEAFYSLKMGLPFVAATSWHSVNRTQTMLTREQFDQVFPVLEASAPGQNLDRRVKVNGVVVGERVVSFDFGKSGVKDLSGNGFDAKLSKGATLTNDGIVLKDGAHIATPLGSKGANYTLSLNFKTQFPLPPNSPSASLLTGPDTALLLVPTQNGSTTLTFLSSNVTYPLNNFVFPNSASRTVHLVIQGTEDETTAFVDGTSVGGFETLIRRIEQFRPMGFVAPLSQVGGPGFTGTISEFRVLDGLHAP